MGISVSTVTRREFLHRAIISSAVASALLTQLAKQTLAEGGVRVYPETPEDVHRLWVEAFNRGNLYDLMALYEPGAAFVAQPGQIVSGAGAVRKALAGLLAMRPTINLQLRKVIPAGEIAQIISSWTITGTNPDGSPATFNGVTTDVVRRQGDGRWLLVIDNPFGAAAAG